MQIPDYVSIVNRLLDLERGNECLRMVRSYRAKMADLCGFWPKE
jgi:hypothetical protein